MEVLPIGSGISPVENVELHHTRELSGSPSHAADPQRAPFLPSATDSASALISEIAAADIPKLTALLEHGPPPKVATHVNDLTHDTTLALMQSDTTRALANVKEIATIDPNTLAVLEPEKVLEPIRAEVDQVLNRLTTVAKIDAEGWLSHADDAVEAPGHTSIPNWQTKPETLLHVAHRLFDSGGYANYVHSADLAKTILNYSPLDYSPWPAQYAQSLGPKPEAATARLVGGELLRKRPAIATAHKAFTAARKAASPRLQTLWRRAPLLILLLGWLTIGLVAGPASILLRTLAPASWSASLIDFSFEIWAVGFLALVCFGFYARIRNVRS